MTQHCHHQQDKAIGFKNVQLLKDQTLGIGSYGIVCKAKCDDLLCAAKILHQYLVDPTGHELKQVLPQREHRLPMRRFEQECEFLSTIRHPNIVQYLGMYQDPDTGSPVLLMELMDDSLTHFLESSPQPIPYHIQVNICDDIALALSFLHSNNIVHRDLSSNNVLLIGNVRAKVTDFGMARLGDPNSLATRLSFTKCPGAQVYMPPEAVKDKPVYTEKIDCFSFGVVIVQILTQQFPGPGDHRQNCRIDPNHPLRPVAFDCLNDIDTERPSAKQLCKRVAALKETPKYKHLRVSQVRGKPEQNSSKERDEELRSPRAQYSQQVQDLQLTSKSKQETNRSRQLTKASKSGQVTSSERAPRKMCACFNSVTDGNTVYIKADGNNVYAYTMSTSTWSQLPDSPYSSCPIVVINALPTLIGGCKYNSATTKLCTLTRIGRHKVWNDNIYPPMPTKRWGAGALCTGVALIVAGGRGEGVTLKTVEVMDTLTEDGQWFTTSASLPEPLLYPSVTACGEHVYMLGGQDNDMESTKSVYTCPVSSIMAMKERLTKSLTPPKETSVWSRVGDLPVTHCMCVSLHGQLLAVGGKDQHKKTTTAVHKYNPNIDSWEVISHMETPRSDCYVAILRNNKLMVIGGRAGTRETDSVEYVTVHL